MINEKSPLCNLILTILVAAVIIFLQGCDSTEPDSTTNLTITVDPSSWFIKEGMVLDPNNPENENDIDNNIKDSFNRCFRDNNHDGDEG